MHMYAGIIQTDLMLKNDFLLQKRPAPLKLPLKGTHANYPIAGQISPS